MYKGNKCSQLGQIYTNLITYILQYWLWQCFIITQYTFFHKIVQHHKFYLNKMSLRKIFEKVYSLFFLRSALKEYYFWPLWPQIKFEFVQSSKSLLNLKISNQIILCKVYFTCETIIPVQSSGSKWLEEVCIISSQSQNSNQMVPYKIYLFICKQCSLSVKMIRVNLLIFSTGYLKFVKL